jgi:formate dehydrogenase major subunit
MSYARLNQTPGLCWPCPTEDHPGTPILHVGGHFATSSGKAVLTPVAFVAETPKPDGDYKFMLFTGRRVYHFGTGTMTRRARLLADIGPEELIELHPGDADALSVREGDFIKVSTPHGAIVAKAWITGRVPPGTVFATFHFWEANAHEAAGAAKRTPANVTKISSADARADLAQKTGSYRPDLERTTTARRHAGGQVTR